LFQTFNDTLFCPFGNFVVFRLGINQYIFLTLLANQGNWGLMDFLLH
jgi:hypothetical protein